MTNILNKKLSFKEFLIKSINEKIEFSEKQIGKHQVITFSDELGGSGFLKINDEIADIIDWHSVPSSERFLDTEDIFKRRGFAKAVLTAIKHDLGISEISIKIQSIDTQAVLNKLTQNGVLTSIDGYFAGVSTNRYPTRFKIN